MYNLIPARPMHNRASAALRRVPRLCRRAEKPSVVLCDGPLRHHRALPLEALHRRQLVAVPVSPAVHVLQIDGLALHLRLVLDDLGRHEIRRAHASPALRRRDHLGRRDAHAPSPRVAAAPSAVRMAVVPRVLRAARRPQALDEPVEHEELDLELDAVHARLEGALQVEQVVAAVLDAEQGDVERDDEQVGQHEVPQHAVLGALGRRGERARVPVGGRRGPGGGEEGAEVDGLAGLVDVEEAEGGLLDEEDGELDAVPDDVLVGQGGIDIGGLL